MKLARFFLLSSLFSTSTLYAMDKVKQSEITVAHQIPMLKELAARGLSHTRPIELPAFLDANPHLDLVLGQNHWLENVESLWRFFPESSAVSAGHGYGRIQCVFVKNSSHFVTAGSDGVLRLWSCENEHEGPTIVKSVKAHAKRIRALLIHPQHTALFTASDDQTVSLWSIPKLEKVKTWDQPAPVSSLALSPDQQTVAAGYVTGEIGNWHVKSESKSPLSIERIPAFTEGSQAHAESPLRDFVDDPYKVIHSLQFSDNNTLLAGCLGIVKCIYISAKQCIRTCNEIKLGQIFTAMNLTPDEALVGYASGNIDIVSPHGGPVQTVAALNKEPINTIARIPGSNLLLLGSSKKIYLFLRTATQTGNPALRLIRSFECASPLLTASMSPDNAALMCADVDGNSTFWSCKKLAARTTLKQAEFLMRLPSLAHGKNIMLPAHLISDFNSIDPLLKMKIAEHYAIHYKEPSPTRQTGSPETI